ncbi:MAG: hypothetical protein ACD_28C00218G0001 [uncultured bacterium]|nr:MAG: hypothetical protein ACD_28C00218G0001 [uncultured bacterium]KKT76642.1 MAG: 5-formyltetrahydrofolate cyclo-ligase [Candidatus Peregrinibacteria bacterium GW2011_GWA2_44_7]
MQNPFKTKIRESIRSKRKELSPEAKTQKDEAIQKRIENWSSFQQAKCVFIYVSLAEEVDTHRLIQSQLGKKEILIPRIDNEQKNLEAVPLKHWSDLAVNQWGMLETRANHRMHTHYPIDLIIVPGIAFDPRGYRIGYGKGFYDKFLDNHPGLKTLGLAYDLQILEKVPCDSHDIPVQQIFTESRSLHSVNTTF